MNLDRIPSPGRQTLHQLILTAGLLGAGCGVIATDVKKYDRSHDGVLSNPAETANLDVNTDVSIIPMKCLQEKNDLAFANSVYQNIFSRSLKDSEIQDIHSGPLDRTSFVKTALGSPEAGNGITRFITNLLRLDNITIMDTNDQTALIEDSLLVADLKKEPAELVLRNLDKPWNYFFTTKDVFCTKETAKVYGVAEFESSAFISCQLPEDRAGFLGLASVLRANPSSMVSENNNYHRVALAVYLAVGIKLLSATNGPTGDGLGIPLPACVPATDTRVTSSGLIYGTASVPAAGSVCASCHSRYNGPLSVAFRRFKPDGSTFSIEDINQVNNAAALGTSNAQLRVLLNETESCWSFDGIAPARRFSGVPGLGELIADAGTLGTALGVQIPQMLGNVEPDPNMSSTIRKYFQDGGETLSAALEGYLLSDSFQCAIKEE